VIQDDIKVVLEQLSELTHFGFGIFGDGEIMSPEVYQANFNECQKELLNSPESCTRICEWLNHVGKAKSINGRDSSYGLKHVVEKATGKYCSNGEFICAAIHMGFKFRRHGPNADFNMSVPDLIRLKKDAEAKQMDRERVAQAVPYDK